VDHEFPPSVLVHQADGPTGSMVFLHNLADRAETVDLGELAGEADHPNQVFGNHTYDGELDLTKLRLDPYGYRWIRLARNPAF
jgi:maltose alpha-D-glucosyltransferase/alpha-amylase